MRVWNGIEKWERNDGNNGRNKKKEKKGKLPRKIITIYLGHQNAKWMRTRSGSNNDVHDNG